MKKYIKSACGKVEKVNAANDDNINGKYEKEAELFAQEILALANNPERLENLQSYLSHHFDWWLNSRHTSTPSNFVAELRNF